MVYFYFFMLGLGVGCLIGQFLGYREFVKSFIQEEHKK